MKERKKEGDKKERKKERERKKESKKEREVNYLSLFLVRRFLSMPSIRFLNQVAMLACLAAGCDEMICRDKPCL
jgi:hypothetical protein